MSAKLTVNRVLTTMLQAHVQNLSTMALSRQGLASSVLDPEGRNLDKDCGYPQNPQVQTYKLLYDRHDIAARVVDVYPDECWSVKPELYETEDPVQTPFETAWRKLLDTSGMNPWHYLHRIDRLSGIGRFGLLLFGFQDGRDLNEPVAGLNDRGDRVAGRPPKLDLAYMRTFDESYVQIASYDADKKSPRYGQPLTYQVTMADPAAVGLAAANPASKPQLVHWTRVLHVADNRGSCEWAGTPRQQQVVNRLMDVRKTAGGSAEMFWRGAFPGYSFETFPELTGDAEMDEDSVKEEFEAYANGLRRYMKLVGMTAKSLAPQVADPTNHLTQQLQLICATLGIPLRVFLGSEAGHLASSQDSVTWNRRLSARQTDYLEPFVIRPFVDRLMLVGVLPQVPQFYISWKDLNAMSDKDRGDTSLKMTQALLQYITSKAYKFMRPRQFLTFVMRYTEDEAEAILKAGGGEDAVYQTLIQAEQQEQQAKIAQIQAKTMTAGGNGPNTKAGDPAAKTGAGGQRNALGGPSQA